MKTVLTIMVVVPSIVVLLVIALAAAMADRTFIGRGD